MGELQSFWPYMYMVSPKMEFFLGLVVEDESNTCSVCNITENIYLNLQDIIQSPII